MNDKKICSSCNHWKPVYFNVGCCTAEGMPNAKFWVEEQKRLLTASTFSCQSFIQINSVASESL